MCAGSILWGQLRLSHLHGAPGLGPRWVPVGSRLLGEVGSILWLLAKDVSRCILTPRCLCCARSEKRCLKEASSIYVTSCHLMARSCKAHYCCLKRREKLKKEGKASFLVLVLHLQDPSCSELCVASCVGHTQADTCDTGGTGTAYGGAGLCSPGLGVAEFNRF